MAHGGGVVAGVWVDEGGGMHAGHVAYLWRHRDVAYLLSAHGYANEPRVRAMMDALSERVLTAGP